jgi:hypothetical protein
VANQREQVILLQSALKSGGTLLMGDTEHRRGNDEV